MPEAVELFENDRKTYPDKHRYLNDVKARAKVDGFVQSIFGKKRRLDYTAARGDEGKLEALDRAGANTIIQGPSSDIGVLCMDRCMKLYDEAALDVLGIGTIHDSMMNDSSEEDAETALQIQFNVMESYPTELLGSDHVLFRAEMESGYDWGHMKPWSPS